MSLRSTAVMWKAQQPGGGNWRWVILSSSINCGICVISLLNNNYCCFTAASFDSGSSLANSSDPVGVTNCKDWGGIWWGSRHPRVRTRVCLYVCLGFTHKMTQYISLSFCSYMRHAYGLGEHYNSVEQLKDVANVEDSWETAQCWCNINPWRATRPLTPSVLKYTCIWVVTTFMEYITLNRGWCRSGY